MSTQMKKNDPLSIEEIETLLETISVYDTALESVEKDLSMKGKALGDAQREQASNSYFYGVRKAEIGALVKKLDTRIMAIRGRLVRWFKTNDAMNSSERQIEKYVDSHDEYLDAMAVFHYADEIYKKYIEVEAAFEKRGFAIRDFTQSRIEQIHQDVI